MQYQSSLSKATMQPLWPFISLLILFCFTPSSLQLNSTASDAGVTQGTSHCWPVPFPFGVPGVALQGFEVACTSNTTTRTGHLPYGSPTGDNLPSPSLLLPTGTYLIKNISLQGQVWIVTKPIYQRCYLNGKEVGSPATGWLNLAGTPFTLSKNYTTLIAVGCNDVAMIEGVVEGGISRGTSFKSGCVAFCSNSSSRINGSCSGLGCCQMPLPEGLKSFKLSFYELPDMKVNRLTSCSVAFFAMRDEFSFSTALFDNQYYWDHSDVVVLDWAIGNKTCKEAEKDSGSFVCKEHSECYDSPNGEGYLCNCSKGYEGNPYLGCRDINECEDPETNQCTEQCINTNGSYTCASLRGVTGNRWKERSGTLIATLGSCLVLLFILAMVSFYVYSRQQKRNLLKMRSEFFRQNGGLTLRQKLSSQGIDTTTRIFTEEELQRATDNYKEARILGRGGYGTVYKGVLSDQRVVAIKRSKLIDESQVEQFINEITILSQINHRNVVKLLGCCLETQVPLLVYEFVSNGTLFEHIHNRSSLRWEVRLRIATQTCRAIAYLHSAASFPIIHRDIKSSNILLDENYTAKVSDFGASRSVPFDQTHVTTLVQGTLGYLDPEYFHTSQLTDKSDVYSFGVVLAELLTGEMPVSFLRSEDYRSLAIYFSSLFDQDRLIEAIDRSIQKEARLDELHFVAHITRRCLNVKGEERPSMKEIALELEGLRKTVKKRANDENIEEERLVKEEGSTSAISEVLTEC